MTETKIILHSLISETKFKLSGNLLKKKYEYGYNFITF